MTEALPSKTEILCLPLVVCRPKSGNLNSRYILMGEIVDFDPLPGRPWRVYLVDADHPSIATTAFRADEIEEVT